MSEEPKTPFEDIEGALKYTHLLLDATREAHQEIEVEIARTTDATLARRKEALQLVSHKLATLETHIGKSRRILNDLRSLRRLLLEERSLSASQS